MSFNESEADCYKRRAQEHLDWCKDQENTLRIQLARAVQATKSAREQYELAYLAAEKAAIAKTRESWKQL